MTQTSDGDDRAAVLLDSTILIDHLNGIEPATRYLRETRGVASISAITRAEVLTGYGDGAEALIARLLDQFPLVVIDGAVADLAARLRHRYRWRLPDALQAAAARLHGLRLATRNRRDFSPRRHRFVTVPYRL